MASGGNCALGETRNAATFFLSITLDSFLYDFMGSSTRSFDSSLPLVSPFPSTTTPQPPPESYHPSATPTVIGPFLGTSDEVGNDPWQDTRRSEMHTSARRTLDTNMITNNHHDPTPKEFVAKYCQNIGHPWRCARSRLGLLRKLSTLAVPGKQPRSRVMDVPRLLTPCLNLASRQQDGTNWSAARGLLMITGTFRQTQGLVPLMAHRSCC